MYLRAKRRRWRGAGVGVERGEREGVEGRGKGVHGRCGAVCQPYVLSPSRPSPLPPPRRGKAAVEPGVLTCPAAR